jgi:hypothetical protein
MADNCCTAELLRELHYVTITVSKISALCPSLRMIHGAAVERQCQEETEESSSGATLGVTNPTWLDLVVNL